MLPLRFERTVIAEGQRGGAAGLPPGDRNTLDIGKVVRMEIHRRREDGKMVIERAVSYTHLTLPTNREV